ncbi:MFS transporter [Tessaracoccus caeni]|uniref:MFS transporter n=1 Tax=Tessaracoccus caeni TaxID=3031239 RepID=UPI0023DBD061|nr:MFS transporter [Tessaracoccus caeni]MDF1489598.1 MFS transporter [Tessaracoccus caeni]
MNENPTDRSWVRLTTLFLGGQAVSLFGSGITQFALLWYVTMGTQSGVMMTVAVIVGFVPMMLLAPFGGVLADRLNRRHLIAGADAMVALSTLALIIAFALGYGSYTLVFIAMGLRALGGGIQGPAVGALLPQIVPTEQLGRVNGYNASIQSAVNLVSPMVAGALYAVASIEWLLVIDVVTAIIGIGILLVLVKVPPHAAAANGAEQSGMADLVEGVKYVNGHRFVRRLMAYFALVNFMIAPLAFLTPLQVTRTFANDAWHLAAVEVAFAVGMFLGGIAIGSWGGFRSRVTTTGVAIAATGVTGILLGIPFNFVLYLVWMFLCGVIIPAFNTPAITMLQLAVEERFMGRVFSVVTMIGTGAMPLGMLLFGPMADYISVELLLIVTGALLVAIGVVILLDRTTRELEPRTDRSG